MKLNLIFGLIALISVAALADGFSQIRKRRSLPLLKETVPPVAVEGATESAPAEPESTVSPTADESSSESAGSSESAEENDNKKDEKQKRSWLAKLWAKFFGKKNGTNEEAPEQPTSLVKDPKFAPGPEDPKATEETTVPWYKKITSMFSRNKRSLPLLKETDEEEVQEEQQQPEEEEAPAKKAKKAKKPKRN